MDNVLDRIQTLADPESGNGPAIEADFVQFLNDNAFSDYIVLYASARNFFFHGVLVPRTIARAHDIDDLLNWSGNPFDSWAIGGDNSIRPPLSTFRSRGVALGEQIIFLRTFSGLSENKSYVEIWQKLLHVLDLHYMRERNAWCRLDRHGDIEEAIKVVERQPTSTDTGEVAVLVSRDCLAEYTQLSDSALLFMFDFVPVGTAAVAFSNSGDAITEVPVRDADNGIHYRCRESSGSLVWMGGIQILSVTRSLVDSAGTQTRYESYLALDWKNGEVREVSCSPDALSNYFIESSLPYDMSPVFFRPEVLSKYKADREKYSLEDRSIGCRGAWHLQTYDINAAGQVHTYLVYLRQLPHEEQLYWKSFNERPKAPISERAFKTDFAGEISYSEGDPLANLKETLRVLRVSWWTLKTHDEVQWAHYPVTGSNDEWRNEIQRLDRLLIEGLEERWLRRHALKLGVLPDDNDRSIALLEKCLVGYGVKRDEAKDVVRPFRELRDHRSKFSHAAGREARRLKEVAFQDHGGYRQHYTQLVSNCLESMMRIDKQFGKSGRT